MWIKSGQKWVPLDDNLRCKGGQNFTDFVSVLNPMANNSVIIVSASLGIRGRGRGSLYYDRVDHRGFHLRIPDVIFVVYASFENFLMCFINIFFL